MAQLAALPLAEGDEEELRGLSPAGTGYQVLTPTEGSCGADLT